MQQLAVLLDLCERSTCCASYAPAAARTLGCFWDLLCCRYVNHVAQAPPLLDLVFGRDAFQPLRKYFRFLHITSDLPEEEGPHKQVCIWQCASFAIMLGCRSYCQGICAQLFVSVCCLT